MNSQEVGQLCGGFLAQVRGIFAGIEKLPAAFEELEAREAAAAAKDARLGTLDQAIARKEAELATVESRVREKMLAEQTRQRAEMKAKLADLLAQVDSAESRKQTAMEAADREELRLRRVHENIGKLGLSPLAS